MPIVIVFVLMVLFLFVVIGVMYSRSQRQIAQSTEVHTSAAKQADSIIPKQLAWAPTPPEPTPTPKPVPAVPAVSPPTLIQPTPDPLDTARMQALQTALAGEARPRGHRFTQGSAALRPRTTTRRPEARAAAWYPRPGQGRQTIDPGTGAPEPTSRASANSTPSIRTAGRATPGSKIPRGSCCARAA